MGMVSRMEKLQALLSLAGVNKCESALPLARRIGDDVGLEVDAGMPLDDVVRDICRELERELYGAGDVPADEDREGSMAEVK